MVALPCNSGPCRVPNRADTCWSPEFGRSTALFSSVQRAKAPLNLPIHRNADFAHHGLPCEPHTVPNPTSSPSSLSLLQYLTNLPTACFTTLSQTHSLVTVVNSCVDSLFVSSSSVTIDQGATSNSRPSYTIGADYFETSNFLPVTPGSASSFKLHNHHNIPPERRLLLLP